MPPADGPQRWLQATYLDAAAEMGTESMRRAGYARWTACHGIRGSRAGAPRAGEPSKVQQGRTTATAGPTPFSAMRTCLAAHPCYADEAMLPHERQYSMPTGQFETVPLLDYPAFLARPVAFSGTVYF